MAKSPAWTRKEGKAESGGLNAKGRASYNKANPGKPGLKAPQPEGGARRDSFCARMSGVVEHSKGEAPRAKASLKRWKCLRTKQAGRCSFAARRPSTTESL